MLEFYCWVLSAACNSGKMHHKKKLIDTFSYNFYLLFIAKKCIYLKFLLVNI